MKDLANPTLMSKLGPKVRFLISRLALLRLVAGIIVYGCAHVAIEGMPGVEFREDFSKGRLDSKRWVITKEGDFREWSVDVIRVDSEFKLRLRADTIGTSPKTVKYCGVRCLHKIELDRKKTVTVNLDWNDQINGCYLTAAVYICPSITNGNVRQEQDWIRVEYTGVPPGKNVRCAISTKIDGRVKYLYTEGWPINRKGRKIDQVVIGITMEKGGLIITEDGRELCSSTEASKFAHGWLYLQISSQSNYPAREIYFDNVVVAKKAF